MGYLLASILGYLLGCSSMALYLSKWKGKDLRSGGSKNLGASNAAVLLGWRAGILVALHDISKAWLSVALAIWLFPALEYAGAAAGVACVLGHIFPFYLKFKGGKGLASFFGMTLGLNWKLALIVMAVVILATIVTDYIVIGTFSTIVLVPTYTAIVSHNLILALILCVASVTIFCKHWENIGRILRREEIGLRSTIRGDHRKKQT